MDSHSDISIKRERKLTSFILKCSLLQFLFVILCCITYRDSITTLFHTDVFANALVISALWNVTGMTLCLYIQAPKIAFEVQKILIFVLFFAPTASLLSIGPILNGNENPNFPKISEMFYQPPVKSEFDSLHIFYARDSIEPGEPITAQNTIVLAGYRSDLDGAVKANGENHFGNLTDANSILHRKAKRSIDMGAPIRNSEIDPPFSDQFVFHQK